MFGNALFKICQRFFRLLFEADVDEHIQVQPQGFGVGQGHVALNHPGGFEGLDPGQTGRRREVHTACQFYIGQRAVLLQFLQNFQINRVEFHKAAFSAVFIGFCN